MFIYMTLSDLSSPRASTVPKIAPATVVREARLDSHF
jgi:hypothetical protein